LERYVFYFIYDAIALGTNPWQLVKNFISVTIKESVKFYSQLPLKAEEIKLIKDNETIIISGFIQIFPSMVIILSVVSCMAESPSGQKLFAKGRHYLSRICGA